MKSENKITYLILAGLVVLALSFFSTNTAVIDEPLDVNITNQENGDIQVVLKDLNTRPIDLRVNKIINSNYSLASTPTIGSYNFTLDNVTGLIVGDNIALIEQNGMPQLYFGEILNIVSNTIVLDAPVPFNYSVTAQVIEYDVNLSVDGSTTPQVFEVFNVFDDSIDITRFIWYCLDNTAMDDNKFCGQPFLTRGIVLRKLTVDGHYINYWNVKSNGEFGSLAYDKDYSSKAPAGFYGFTTRLSYAGQENHGVAIKLNTGEKLELIIQDDLTDIEKISLTVKGHFNSY